MRARRRGRGSRRPRTRGGRRPRSRRSRSTWTGRRARRRSGPRGRIASASRAPAAWSGTGAVRRIPVSVARRHRGAGDGVRRLVRRVARVDDDDAPTADEQGIDRLAGDRAWRQNVSRTMAGDTLGDRIGGGPEGARWRRTSSMAGAAAPAVAASCSLAATGRSRSEPSRRGRRGGVIQRWSATSRGSATTAPRRRSATKNRVSYRRELPGGVTHRDSGTVASGDDDADLLGQLPGRPPRRRGRRPRHPMDRGRREEHVEARTPSSTAAGQHTSGPAGPRARRRRSQPAGDDDRWHGSLRQGAPRGPLARDGRRRGEAVAHEGRRPPVEGELAAEQRQRRCRRGRRRRLDAERVVAAIDGDDERPQRRQPRPSRRSRPRGRRMRDRQRAQPLGERRRMALEERPQRADRPFGGHPVAVLAGHRREPQQDRTVIDPPEASRCPWTSRGRDEAAPRRRRCRRSPHPSGRSGEPRRRGPWRAENQRSTKVASYRASRPSARLA